MLIRRTSTVDALFDPEAPGWGGVAGETVSLMPAPAAMQPTRYIATKWRDISYGKVNALDVKGVHDGSSIAFRLRWRDPEKNTSRFENTDFPDAAAMLFPLSPDAPLLMGAPGQRVNLWYWRADHLDRARNDVATGIGSSRVIEGEVITARAAHDGEFWTVILRRALRVDAHAGELVQIEAGQRLNTAFAVWEGSNLERAGIKAFSPQWLELEIEA